MNVAARVKAILTDPMTAWARIENEADDPGFLLSRYAGVLALIPALAGFAGATLIGVIVPGGATARASLFNGASGAVFGYVMSCATALVLGLVIDLLAPLFGGGRNFNNAFKLAVYSLTPVWIAGMFLVLPGLRFIVLTGCYGAYLLWLGLPRLAKVPEEQAANFTAVIVVCAWVLLYLTAVAQRVMFGTPGL
ncbi:MAG TPA: Yip1 family protein [Xanthobacteraceae bacterium]|nr:Yip1 family protein [Xanthobacteraceae bacterium]